MPHRAKITFDLYPISFGDRGKGQAWDKKGGRGKIPSPYKKERREAQLIPTAGSPTITLLRLNTSYQPYRDENINIKPHKLDLLFKAGIHIWSIGIIDWQIAFDSRLCQSIKLYKINPFRVKPIPSIWRAVCTRSVNIFTVACWSTITSDSSFMFSSCREQSELRRFLKICSDSHHCISL